MIFALGINEIGCVPQIVLPVLTFSLLRMGPKVGGAKSWSVTPAKIIL